MEYDITRPWLTLDPWQKKYIETPPDKDCFLLTSRQNGKTTAMSIKAVEICLKHFKKGEFVMINSITEKQAYHMLSKALTYAMERYPNFILKGKNKPTMHKLLFSNGTGILCYAAGQTGMGLRGFTIKKHLVDEGSRMSEEFFTATQPMISITKGSMDIASTPFGKYHIDGTEKFFYRCSKDTHFIKFFVSAEDCPRHSKEFLARQRELLSKAAYAQEYLAQFTDELKRLIDDELIKEASVLYRDENKIGTFYLGVDIAGMGKDDCTFELFEQTPAFLDQRENIIVKRVRTTDTTRKVIMLNSAYKSIRKIGVDDGGLGFGVYCELMENDSTKRKTIALNNASRPTDKEGLKTKKLLKEEMYLNFLSMLENKKVRLLMDDEVKVSLQSIQVEEGKIFGAYSHIAEGIVRACWLATQAKSLNVFAHSF